MGGPYDVSATKLSVVITSGGIGNATITDDFADDQQPLSVEPVEATDYEQDINNKVLFGSKLAMVNVSVCVVPNSQADLNLQQILRNSRPGSGASYSAKQLTMAVTDADGKVATYTEGRILSGILGRSANKEGRYVGNTYTFVFKSA